MHALPIRVYYEDTDAGGVVYYANYLKFAERGRTDWLRDLGIHQAELRERSGLFFVVRHCEIDYLAAGKLDDLLTVESRLLRMSNTSIAMHQIVRRDADQAVLAEMKVTVVCVNETLKPARIPQEIREKFNVETKEEN